MNASDDPTPDADPPVDSDVESSRKHLGEPTDDAADLAERAVTVGRSELGVSDRASVRVDALRPELPTPHTAEELAAEPATRCLNCGAELPGPYCPACGQRAERLRRPVHLFLRDAGTEMFGIDGRVWRTLGTLLVKPGTLTLAYLQGRRRRYLTPLRVYLVATLTFFVLLTLTDPIGDMQFGRGGVADDSTVQVVDLLVSYDADLARYDSLRATGPAESLSVGAIEDRVRAQIEADSILNASAAGRIVDIALSVEERQDLIDEMVDEVRDSLGLPDADDELRMRVARGILGAMPADTTVRIVDLREASSQMVPEMNVNAPDFLPEWFLRSNTSRMFSEARSAGQVSDAGVELFRSTLRQVPTVLFLLLPVYALLLKLLYIRRDWFYSEHVVFGLHVHAYAFCVGVAIVFVSLTGWWGGVMTTFYTVTGLSIPVYFVIAQKRVYAQSWRKTLLKATVLGVCYSFLILTAGLTLSIALALVRG